MVSGEYLPLRKSNYRVFCLIFIAILLACLTGCMMRENSSVHAVSGVADLSRNFSATEIIDLNGEWEFYPGMLLTPSDFKDSEKKYNPVLIHIPGDWNGVQSDRGYGTFRLKVLLHPDRINYTLKIKWIKTICRIWIDNNLLTEIGEIKVPVEDSVPGGYISLVDFSTGRSEAELIVQVVNFQDRRGGLCYPLSIGPPSAVYSAELFSTFLNSVVLGALAIVIIFHLTIFLHFRKTTSNLYIAFICFMVMIRIFVLSNSYFIFSLVEHLGYGFLVKAEFVALILVFVFLLRFFVQLYLPERNSFLYRGLQYFGLLSLIYIISAPVYYVKAALPVFQLFILLTTIYVGAGAVFSGVRRKMKGARIYFFILIIALFAFINDILYFLISIGPGPVSQYVFVLFLTGHFFIIAMYFSEIFQENAILIEEIGVKKDIVKDLSYISTIDSLTELHNRRFFDSVLNTIVKDYKKDDKLWLIMFDIDHFKNINDDFGHGMGDVVLKEFSGVVKGLIRTRDILARWGGEEFCIIVAEMDMKLIVLFTERIRESIENYIFSVDRSITASFGIARYRYDESADGFVSRADSALYIAKKSGRNRVVVDPGSIDIMD